jgi:hypothetical protein
VLRDNYVLKVTEDCALQVHVGAAAWNEDSGQYLPAQYSLRRLQSVAKAALLFEEATKSIMPQHRKYSRFAPPMYLGDATPSTLRGHYVGVPEDTWAGLFDFFDDVRDKDELNSKIGGSERSWNFTHTSSAGVLKTLEFRRPPGVVHEDAACYWAKFALGFVSAANPDYIQIFKSWTTKPDSQCLFEFIQNGLALISPTYAGTFYRAEGNHDDATTGL